MRAFFFVGLRVPKGKSWSQAFLAETLETETGYKNRDENSAILYFVMKA